MLFCFNKLTQSRVLIMCCVVCNPLISHITTKQDFFVTQIDYKLAMWNGETIISVSINAYYNHLVIYWRIQIFFLEVEHGHGFWFCVNVDEYYKKTFVYR